MSRILSLIIACVYVIVPLIGVIRGDKEELEGLFGVIGYLALPLACIWFGDELGGLTGIMKMRHITDTSPGEWVSLLGWVLLLMPVIAVVIMALTEKYMSGG